MFTSQRTFVDELFFEYYIVEHVTSDRCPNVLSNTCQSHSVSQCYTANLFYFFYMPLIQ